MEIVNLLILITASVATGLWTKQKLKKLNQMKIEIVDENAPMDSASLLHLAEESEELNYYSQVL